MIFLQPYIKSIPEQRAAESKPVAEPPAVEERTKLLSPSPVLLSPAKGNANNSNVTTDESVNIEFTDGSKDVNNAGLLTELIPVEPQVINNPELNIYLNQLGTTIELAGLSHKLHSVEELKALYNQTDVDLLWFKKGKLMPFGYLLIQALLDSETHALPAEIYHVSAFSALQSGQSVQDVLALDVLLSDGFVTYKKQLTNGIVNPKKQFSTWNLAPRDIDFFASYQQARQDNSFAQVFNVDDPDYEILRQKYNELRLELASQVPFERIKSSRLVKGNRGKNVAILRRKLGISDDTDLFDNELEKAVIDYQTARGLKADGIVGKGTITRLNVSSANFIDLLRINMERMRWNYVPKDQNYVWINIPAYKMRIRNNDQAVFASNVIVGRSKRQTPIFSDTLEHVVLNPYWNVPPTIFKEDKLPKLRNNPYALGGSMQVLDTATGKVVDAGSVNWQTSGKRYRLRQLPGKSNSLGKVKFLFPNKHAIYMHDTPERSLFKRETRALSSGCVRVERANDLTRFLLNQEGWNEKRIKRENSQSKEKWIKLGENLNYPVFINYFTTWVDNGEIVQSRDVYQYDETLKNLYQSTLKQYL